MLRVCNRRLQWAINCSRLTVTSFSPRFAKRPRSGEDDDSIVARVAHPFLIYDLMQRATQCYIYVVRGDAC